MYTNLILASLVLTSDCLFCDEFNHLKVTFKNYILGLHLILVSNLASVGLEKTCNSRLSLAKRSLILP